MARKRKHPANSSSPSTTTTEKYLENNNRPDVYSNSKCNGFHKKNNSEHVDFSLREFISKCFLDTESVNECREAIFPLWTPWLVFITVLFTRLIYVSDSRNWWILHPDEIFQSLEVAFSEVYGYGFRPYEYLPPVRSDVVSPARQQEADLGMHSLRSFLFPRIFMVVMVIGEWLHLKPLLISKVFHAAVCSFLPLSSYFFSRTIFNSHDIASMASVLIGFSVHLTVFGTHTLINSFLSPVVIFALVPLFSGLLRREPGRGEDKYSYSSTNNVHVSEGSETNGGCENNLSKITKINETGIEKTDGDQKKTFILCISGLVLGICCYIRIDLVLLLLMLIAPHCVTMKSKQILLLLDLRVLFPVIVGFTLGMTIGGAEDMFTYGVWFLSPYQWMKFNVGLDFATILFGRQDFDHYFKGFVLYSQSNTILSGVFIAFIVIVAISSNFRRLYSDYIAIITKLLFSSVFLFCIYSLKGHKEMRFMHNVLVLIFIVYSSAIVLCLRYLTQNGISKVYMRRGLYLSICLYIYNQWQLMPSSTDQSNKSWVYNSGWDSNYVNDCFDFISQQSDVTGVFVDRSIHTSAAFTVLRHDVPLFAVIHYELNEFDTTAYLPLKPVSFFRQRDKINIRTLSRISNYVSIYNSHEYLLKILLSKKRYNYLVIKKEKKFVPHGYETVFMAGTMKVLRRTFDRKAEEYLENLSNTLPIGSNSTILEYEGSWLLTYGLYKLAEERLLTALQLGNPSARLFQILIQVFLNQNQIEKARKAEHWCIDRHGLEICRKPQQRIILHTDYDIQLPVR